MATYTLNPKKFTGAEKMIMDALELTYNGVDLHPKLEVPFDTPKAAHSAKAKFWAYVRAMEACSAVQHMIKCGYTGDGLADEQSRLLARAAIARKFTTRIDATPDGAKLVFFLTIDRPQDQRAVEALSEVIMALSQEQNQ